MLTSKQRSYLRSLANTYEPLAHIGKGSVTPATISSMDQIIEARELIKVKVLPTAEGEVREIAHLLGQELQAHVVQVIGRTFVLYRPAKEAPVITLP